METLSTILIIYGSLCIIIGVLKPPFLWTMKKFQVMDKMFKGPINLQTFVIIWGIVAIIIGLLI